MEKNRKKRENIPTINDSFMNDPAFNSNRKESPYSEDIKNNLETTYKEIISIYDEKEVALIRFVGALEESTIEKFTNFINFSISKSLNRIILDFEKLTYVNGSGLKALVQIANRTLLNSDTIIIIKTPVNIYKMFELVGFHQIFIFETTLQNALFELSKISFSEFKIKSFVLFPHVTDGSCQYMDNQNHSTPINSKVVNQNVLDSLFEGCLIISTDWKFLYVNEIAAKQGRRSRNEYLGKSVMEIYPGVENTPVYINCKKCMIDRTSCQMIDAFVFPDKSKSWFDVRIGPVPEGVFILSLEITEAKHSEERIKWLMKHDQFTGLPNRFSLIETMTSIKNSVKSKEPRFLAVISLENVDELEATYGPTITDEILLQIAGRINEVFANEVYVCRSKSHQLGVLYLAKQDVSVEILLNDITIRFGKPYLFKGISVHGDIRIGYSRLPELEEDPAAYLRKSEIALRTASQKSQSWMIFTPEQDTTTAKENLELLGELKEALANGQLSLHYQPKILMESGAVHGVEALMRWNHPKWGNIPPGKFIPRAEQSTLIDSITEWAIDQALAQQVKWAKMGIQLTVAVNLSTRNLMLPSFVDTVIHLLDRHQVKGELLELEVTESAFMLDIERTIVKLKELSDVKIIISIDDFGTGYSSLQYLNDLPISIIKLDQTFIRSLSANKGSNHIVEAAVNLAHSLKMKIVAEGVEDAKSYHYLRDIGCDISQGYFIKRPMTEVAFTKWYQEINGIYKQE